jgi:hypothetical protein
VTTPSLLSLDPFAVDQDAVFDAKLLGTWQAGQEGDLCIVQRNGNAYTVLRRIPTASRFRSTP